MHAFVLSQIEAFHRGGDERVNVSSQLVGIVNERENTPIVSSVAVLVAKRRTGRQA
jgi:hypothetical protein